MTDEKYTFVSDVREKKQIARSSHNRRTHAGKGGAVKLPSDYMTKKEREAMNGECKSYKLNDPMSWSEFKSMPVDIQAAYIKALQKKFGVHGRALSEMFGVAQQNVSAKMKALGVNLGRGHVLKFDSEGWVKWLNGIKEDKECTLDEITIVPEPESPNAPSVDNKQKEDDQSSVQIVPFAVIPESGSLVFECEAQSALSAIAVILQNARVKLRVSWELMNDGRC